MSLLWLQNGNIGWMVLPVMMLNGKELGSLVRMEWIPECGHCPHLEQPQQAAAHILEFIRGEPQLAAAPSRADMASSG